MADAAGSNDINEALLVGLDRAGYPVASVSDLRRSGLRYKTAIPVLLYWLPQVTDRPLKEEIVRALSVPWARPAAARTLVGEFNDVPPTVDPTGSLRWAIGNALEVVFDDSVFDEVSAIIRDREFGISRQMIVLALGRSKRPEAVPLLVSLMDDEDVSGHAVAALAKLGDPAARPALEAKLNDPRRWVRNEAQKGIERINLKLGSA